MQPVTVLKQFFAKPSTGAHANTSTSVQQIVRIQRLIMVDVENVETKAKDRALCARAFECLERLKRDIKMQPRPAPLIVEARNKRGKTAFTEPQEQIAQAAEIPQKTGKTTTGGGAESVPECPTEWTPPQ